MDNVLFCLPLHRNCMYRAVPVTFVETRIRGCLSSLGTTLFIYQWFWCATQLNMLCNKIKNITIDNCLRQKANVISHRGFAGKQSYQGSISQILFGVSIKFLFDSLKSAALKVFQKVLNTNKIFLLHFGVYFALLWKPDFLNEPELLIKRTSEGN